MFEGRERNKFGELFTSSSARLISEIMRPTLLAATFLTAALGLSLPSTPAPSPAYRAVHDLLAERGKLPLAVLGAHLQREGIALDAPLSQFVLEHDSTLRVSGRPSHRLFCHIGVRSGVGSAWSDGKK